MATNNSLTKNQRPKFSVAIQSEGYKNLINQTIGDPKRSARFIASITSAVSVNPKLQECEASTILSAGLLGEALNLSPSPQLGMFYMVPYDDKKRGCKVATFQMGYKGYVQLAIRSGYYKKINVLPIKEGELVSFDPLSEEIEVNLIEDEEAREKAKTIGYYCFFEYLNGFRKAMYWSYQKMLAHADKYSKAFSKEAYEKLQRGEIPQSEMWKYSSFWYTAFDDMGCKTLLRQIISKWGIMSTELIRAFETDESIGVVKGGEIVTEAVEVPEEAAVTIDQPMEADPLA